MFFTGIATMTTSPARAASFTVTAVAPVSPARSASVADDAFVLPERVAEDDVGGFASDAGQFDQSVHRIRNFTVVALDQCFAKSNQALCLVAEEARALDHLFQLIQRCVGERSRCRK